MTPEIQAKYEAVTERARKVETTYSMLQDREKDLVDEIDTLRDEDVLLQKVAELFKFLLNKYVYEYAESFSQIVTEGLQTIYHDQDVAFDIEVEQKRGKVYANFVTEQNGVRANPLESFGGGVSSVVSLLMRVLVLLKADKARYLILDEALAALSTEYIESCGQFLRKLCEELDVNILLVTHNPDFLDQCDNAYMGSTNAKGRLQLREIG
jgi:DNA repair ATPase RecN